MIMEHYSKHLDGKANTDSRRAALAQLADMGMPHKRQEDWRYTNLKPLLAKPFEVSNATVEANGTADIVLINGQLDEGRSNMALLKERGVELLEAMPSFDEAPFDFDSLSYFNQALYQGGLHLSVPAGVDAGSLSLLALYSAEDGDTVQCQNSVTIGAGGQLTLINTVDASAVSGWAHAETLTQVAKGARFDVVQKITGNGAGFLSLTEQAAVHGGTYGNHSLVRHVGSGRHRVEVHLLDGDSHFNARGANLVNSGETFDTLTRVYHAVPDAECDQIFKNVVAKQGSAAFQGRIRVEKDAQHTNADMACKNLLLDRTAEANVKPELLIFADDVKCSHGATVGELDDKAIFYLQQRGIPYGEAKAILVRAFLGDIIEEMPLDDETAEVFLTDIDTWMNEVMA